MDARRQLALTGLAFFGVCGATALGLPTQARAASSVTQTQTLPATTAVWFWRDQQVVQGQIVPPADPTSPAGDLTVGGPDDSGGNPAKTAYLRFDGFAFPAGTRVSSCTLTIAVDQGATPGFPPGMPPAVDAVRATSGFAGSGGPQLGAAKPTDGTEAPVATTYDADSQTFTASIPAICQSWVDDQNIGVGLRTAPGEATPEQVELTASSAKLTASVVVPTGDGAVAPAPPSATASSPSATRATAAAPTAAAASPATAEPPAAPVQVALPAGLLPAPVDVAPAAPAPQVAAQAGTAEETPVAAAPVSAGALDLRAVHSALPGGFWWVALLVAALATPYLVLVSRSPSRAAGRTWTRTPLPYRPRRSVMHDRLR